ncbi:MAG: D-inositol-3-phosphate glycosyltransferase [Gammaproteobacteria bacterium]|jgi:glycosyltransferase involved in cell wall biosynthesis|nr:D-inositol-3-phosphate glycosyltransferase [Gammaproteobacteria bacterium]
MRIIEVATSGTIGTPLMGPVSTVTCELSNRFAARGHEVTLVDFRSEGGRSLLHPAIRVVELTPPPPPGAAATSGAAPSRASAIYQSWSRSYRFAHQLAGRIDLSQADVVHMHSPELGFLLQRLQGIRGAYTAHTPVWSLPQSGSDNASGVGAKRKPSWRGQLYSRLVTGIEQKLIRSASLTVGLGSYLKNAMPAAAVATIPNGVDFSSWSPLDKASARQSLNIDPEDFVAVFTGRIAHVKGVDVLLSAIRLLAGKIPNLKVFVIGSLSGSFDGRDSFTDPYASAMVEAARGLPVSFLGFINNRDARFRQYVAAADISVVPSRLEPQGLVVLESLAMGTPVIGSNTGGIPDMVTPDVGYLFPPGDPVGLAACIRDAFESPQQLQNKHLAARARIEAAYSWDSVADRYLTAFAKTLESRREQPGALPAVAPSV